MPQLFSTMYASKLHSKLSSLIGVHDLVVTIKQLLIFIGEAREVVRHQISCLILVTSRYGGSKDITLTSLTLFDIAIVPYQFVRCRVKTFRP